MRSSHKIEAGRPTVVVRIAWLDYLRALAIACVVVTHSLGAMVGAEKGTYIWWIFNSIDSITHSAVPVLVMISGALLMNHELEMTRFFKGRAVKLLLPFLFWSCILFIGNRALGKPLSSDGIVISFLSDLASNNIHPVYWFVYMIFGLYLIAPMLSCWLSRRKKNEVEVFLAIWLLTTAFAYLSKAKFALNLDFYSGYIGYFVLGHYFRNYEVRLFASLRFAVLLVFAGMSTTIVGNYFADFSTKGYLSCNIAVFAAGVFLSIKNLHHCPSVGWVSIVAKYSYGIYLTHVLFISILNHLGVNCLSVSPLVGPWLVALIAIAGSLVTLYSLSRFAAFRSLTGVQ